METYYQESGRAGRDGLPSECLLFFRPGDVPRQSSMVFYENSGLQNLYDIVRYCQTRRECRRSAFFRHFAEPLQDCNGMCDNCSFSAEVKEMDVSGHAKSLLSVVHDVQENDQRLTMLQLVDKMKVKNKGVGPEMKKDELEQLVIQLILDRVLKEEFQHTAYSTNAYVTIGPLAKQVLQGKKIVMLEVSSKQKGGVMKGSKRSLASSGLVYKLDELRKELSSAHGGIFPHSVLSTQQITLLSTERPKTMEQVEKIIGKLKAQKYGSKILEEIQNYELQHPLPNDLVDEGQDGGNRSKKRSKTKNVPVVIESSEHEA
ncbi:ATP-dependent DNA helicase Q-like 2 isoform X1 [Rhododendron vialii]|uniref:ATP-dependent DNA helicase Q-like 2 isoform X1 n=1 Tax=Rhododendron vialii TaxID=182163 RepID=UPI00266015A5|nr:ATP-dependent DNA helicase Q-like 2 isoform X1 [Rhododendron vialii]